MVLRRPGALEEEAQAIDTVLRAEREAQSAVEEARQRASHRLAEAREEAGRIVAQADRRAARAHRRCSERVDEAIARMRQKHAALERARRAAQPDEEHLEAALEELVDWLLGSSEHDPGEETFS